jgi:hypothetical protein
LTLDDFQEKEFSDIKQKNTHTVYKRIKSRCKEKALFSLTDPIPEMIFCGNYQNFLLVATDNVGISIGKIFKKMDFYMPYPTIIKLCLEVVRLFSLTQGLYDPNDPRRGLPLREPLSGQLDSDPQAVQGHQIRPRDDPGPDAVL